MAQQRQQTRDLLHVNTTNGNSDHVSIGVRPAAKLVRNRRTARAEKHGRVLLGAVAGFVALALFATAFGYYYISTDDGSEINSYNAEKGEFDLLKEVIHRDRQRALRFGRGSAQGGDSRYWDRDDRRRDEDYNEDVADHASRDSRDEYIDKTLVALRAKDGKNKSPIDYAIQKSERAGFYNEAGRDELKLYEAKYEASLQSVGQISKEKGTGNQLPDDNHLRILVDADNEYDDGIDSDDILMDDHNNSGNKKEKHLENERWRSHESHDSRIRNHNIAKKVDKVSVNSVEKNSILSSKIFDTKNSRHVNVNNDETGTSQSVRKKKPKHRKFSGSCEMKLLNSTVQLVEPLESRKFARFSLHYTKEEEKPTGQEHWEPRFAGHQTLQERGQSFLARDQKINCGFVKGPKGFPSTGFDLAEDDVNYISGCHIAVVSAIFGNSDRLRSPTGKKVTRLSRKNVCFVMFIDEGTLQTLSSEGQMLDSMGFIGLWKIVVVKNLPFTDMRRVGKIPKLLSHRLFTSARYSIWLDSKLRLQVDPLLILEYFLWRKGYEFAISNHYDRHCLWEEVVQNKKLNKYNHTVIDQQFAFYQADGLKRFNASDPNKLLPSNVPEGSFIVRAHTPMSNLFSCLWFNEVDRFTPRDQLSFFYTYQKLTSMNPDKPFRLNMFKDCERRSIAKLYRHRSDENLNAQAKE